MATLAELRTVFGDGEMIGLVESAMIVKAADILGEVDPTQVRLDFALGVTVEPGKYSQALWRFLLGGNESAPIGSLVRSVGSASDPDDNTIKTAVNSAIDALWP